VAWIETVDPARATGLLGRIYEAATRRAGKVFQILVVQSANPRVLEGGIGLYVRIMRGASPLSRAQRERVATVVSAANHCHY